MTQRVQAQLDEVAVSEPIGDLSLKGFARPVKVFSVRGLDAARSTL